MLLKLLLLFISFVLFVGCGNAAPKPQIQEKEVLKEEKTVGIWNSKSNATLSQREYDKAIKVYVDKKYPEKAEAYKKEIISEAKIEREKERERQGSVFINGLRWQDNKEAKTIQMNLENAEKHCRNLRLTGFNDWRLPTGKELKSIVDKSRSPAIDEKFENVNTYNYWSSSFDWTDWKSAWGVSFNTGNLYRFNKNDNYYVRCVRGGQ